MTGRGIQGGHEAFCSGDVALTTSPPQEASRHATHYAEAHQGTSVTGPKPRRRPARNIRLFRTFHIHAVKPWVSSR